MRVSKNNLYRLKIARTALKEAMRQLDMVQNRLKCGADMRVFQSEALAQTCKANDAIQRIRQEEVPTQGD